MPLFEEDTPGSDVLGGYAKATRIAPISATKQKEILETYGLKVGWAKGKSDNAISSEAARAAVEKFKADKIKAGGTPSTSTRTQAGTPGRPGASLAGTPGRPRTTAGTPGAPLATRNVSAATIAARTAAPTAVAPSATRIVSAQTMAMRDPNYKLTQTDINRMLVSAGLGGTVPPAYATVTVNDFRSWIERQVRRRAAYQLQIAAASVAR